MTSIDCGAFLFILINLRYLLVPDVTFLYPEKTSDRGSKRPTTLLKRDSNTGVFLQNLQNF